MSADAVEFTITWADHSLSGKLPPEIAARVIQAAMAPTTTLRLSEKLTEEQVTEISRAIAADARKRGLR